MGAFESVLEVVKCQPSDCCPMKLEFCSYIEHQFESQKAKFLPGCNVTEKRVLICDERDLGRKFGRSLGEVCHSDRFERAHFGRMPVVSAKKNA